MTIERKTTADSGLAKGGLTCFDETFVVKQTFVLRMNICGKNPALRQAAKRVCLESTRESGKECCTKDGSPLAMIERKPKPSELSRGIIIINKGIGLPQTTFRACPALREVVCKPPYAAISGNSFCGER